MATPWCRLWADMPNDPKWRTISRVSGQQISEVIAVYIHMLVCASNANERGRTQGWCEEDIANALDIETAKVEAICTAMQGRVMQGDRLTGWEKRQPAREDGGAERAKLWRDKKKLEEQEESERKRTQTNAAKRPEIDTDTEEKDKTFCASGDAHKEAGKDYYLTAKKRKLTGERLSTFNEFMTVFGDRRGKAQAADSWYDIKPFPRSLYDEILAGAKKYNVSRDLMAKENRTPKMAQGWLTGKRWEDETAESGASDKGTFCPVTPAESERIRRALAKSDE